MKFVSARKFDLVTTLGHVIAFEKNTPTHVPKALHREAISQGCVAVDGDVDMEDKKEEVVVLDPAERTEMIKMVLADMKERNVSDEFTATGLPKVKIVALASSVPDVTAAEISGLWEALNADA